MDYAAQSGSALGGLFSGALERIKAGLERRSLYSRTVSELSALSDRELADIGIHRSVITDIAQEAAHGR